MPLKIQEIENKLWEAANALRGNLSAEEYMHTILGILSLKYISDRYEVGIKKLKEQGLELSEISKDIFYFEFKSFIVPNEANWKYLMKFATTSEIGQKIDNAFLKLEETNEKLRGIFNKNYNREGIDQIKLGEVIRIFSDEDFSQEGHEDIIGRIYEYFLGKFFKDRGQKGGEFYTPASIVQLIIHVLKPMSGSIYDPACGTCGMLVQSKRYIEAHEGKLDDIMVYGQEYNSVTWKLGKLNLVLNNFPLVDSDGNGVLGNVSADTFTNDQHRDKKFDYVMANPPFNLDNWGRESLLDDPRFKKYGIPPKGNANYAWLEHIISKLSNKGLGACILANGSLSSSGKDEKQIRKNFIESDHGNIVDAIIELPDKLFYNVGIPACIWIFNKNKKHKNVLMISGSSIKGIMVSKKLRELTENDINRISDIYIKHANGEIINEPGFAKTITKQHFEENDYSFVPGRYVEIIEEKIDEEKTKTEIVNLGKELETLFNEFDELVPKVKESIKKAMEFKKED